MLECASWKHPLSQQPSSDLSECYLWGKNFPLNSNIKYEYYANGIHSSYPDFILKDSQGRIHIFEVKSVNISMQSNINSEEYLESAIQRIAMVISKKLVENPEELKLQE